MEDIENVIQHLKKKGLSIADIYNGLGVERGYFDGRRRSTNGHKRKELAKQVVDKFAEYFTDTVEDSPAISQYDDNYRDEYIESLKARIKDLELDKDFLRKIILEKLDAVLSR